MLKIVKKTTTLFQHPIVFGFTSSSSEPSLRSSWRRLFDRLSIRIRLGEIEG